ncbi:alpha/beta hydrolase [Leptolyngbya sp. PCC 6406]|uniref:alpha/beta hydrolase n=1 Tax=Leptolyngbya sp. PCC 6406 TaxID=1173264 RepID=UPI0002ABF376|nr:alpha/beta hydrolase [Leptolyngbya sp. PCC 6406]
MPYLTFGMPLLLSALGLFLSLWILVPAPLRILLPLGVGAPEVSPWLCAGNGLALAIALWARVLQSSTASRIIHGGHWVPLVGSLLGLGLSLVPLSQVGAANAQMARAMTQALGADYLTPIPAAVQATMRPQPFVWVDSFRGLTLAPGRIDRGIVFARPQGIPLALNLYRPLAPGTYPAIVMIYGGAWQSGSPESNEAFSRYMATQGYAVIAIAYRHAPQFRYPIQQQDVQSALAYIQTHGAAWGVDTSRIALMGRSAGAQLAAIAAYAPDSPIPNTPSVRAVVNYYGPVDLTAGYADPPFPDPIDTRGVLETFLGGSPQAVPDLYHQASPATYVRSNLPPTLLVYAGRDHVVQAKFGRQLHRQLQAAGNQAIFLEIPWAEHAFDAVFNGVSNQLALYYTERFLAWALYAETTGE